MAGYGKSWYGSVHENTCISSVSQTPIQRIGLTNCEQNRHLCFAPPKYCVPCFGNLTDTSDRLTNDSLYFLFDFPSANGDTYTLEKYDTSLSVWNEIAVLDNTQGIKYTFGDAIFNDKYKNRSGYRIDSHRILSLYGEGKYRFLVKNTDTYEDSLFSTCFCVLNWSCEKAKNTTKVYTTFTGKIRDWKYQDIYANLGCMNWIDSRRYKGVFIKTIPTKEVTSYIDYDNTHFEGETIISQNYNLELISITREARDRLYYYGGTSKEIFITDYNEHTIGFSQHWTGVSMPNVYSEEIGRGIPIVPFVNILCQERTDILFSRCVPCEPIPPPPDVPEPAPVLPATLVSNPDIVALIDQTSYGTAAQEQAEKFVFGYYTELKLKYPTFTGQLYFEYPDKSNPVPDSERWLQWSNRFVKGKGIKKAVVICFIDESHDVYHSMGSPLSTVPTAKYIQDFDEFKIDYDTYYDSFLGIVYGIPTQDPDKVVPYQGGTTLRDFYVPFQNHLQCAYWGRVVTDAEFKDSFQGDISIIKSENNYDTLSHGLKDLGWQERHQFSDEGINDPNWTYQVFSDDMNSMIDP